MMMNPLMHYAGLPSYSQQQKDRMMAFVPQVAMASADVYAGSALTLMPAQPVTPWVCGVSAVGHGIYGIQQLWPSDISPAHTPTEIARGSGHLITALGFAGMMAGLGAWALPIICIGEATRLVAASVGQER